MLQVVAVTTGTLNSTCTAPVNSQPPTDRQSVFLQARRRSNPDIQPTASEHRSQNNQPVKKARLKPADISWSVANS